ncbi:DUF2723 domain-containing protein [Segetibacter sp.]|uniref:protein O-mannosyl-transferase family n=1 Tax=Segetibacter sp. TaxID=2231182 RepID=UPI00260366EC|nr:DUF2723 domain-containing protein [Segetibacter sp.]MCW3081825.1 rane protein [Segetibacter sp.]
MNYNRVNNITGWIVCMIACAVYLLTTEAGGSLWDCGEFVSTAYKLQVPHPPGAPLFVLLGRFFIILFGDDPNTAARAVNVMSALMSGFTILFLFWTITHFARKIIQPGKQALDKTDLTAVMAAGAVGALAYTFSDSFWFSAVEGEVYALSSVFTAIVFWAIFKWEHAVDSETQTGVNADRWIIFIAFMIGLSIGVHLLNLLTIPAIVLVYYYKRYKATKKGAMIAFAIGCIVTGIVQKAVIQFTIIWAGSFDVFFVNSLGLPFFSGFIAFFVLLAILIKYGLGWANKKNQSFLRLGLWSFTFMLVGYSTYITTMVRSNADPAVDMFNVDNPLSLQGYLSREQYGDFPLVYGQKFTADPIDYKETSTKYIKAKNKYAENGKDGHYVYDDNQMMLFPRVWDASNDQNHRDYYAQFLNIGKNTDGTYERDPDFADNIAFFVSYQTYWMYFRYFMWNFSGRQNDVQGMFPGNVRDGNWITGISFIDNIMYGDQSLMADSSKSNKAHNKLFLLPFLLGIAGLVYQCKKSGKEFNVVFILFLLTGFAVVIYLNQPGFQPRERDYAYVGSFYAFAIWIGLGVLPVAAWLSKKLNRTTATNLATVVCLLAVPVLMASQEWDDHDRSKKQLARDSAKDYLESCAPNAILFTGGDNDTYPLWYAQEVEGIRPDIRVVINPLSGTDWYINQMRYKINQSDPVDLIWSPEQIQGRKRDYVRYRSIPGVSGQQYFDLYDLLKNYVGSDDQSKMMPAGSNEMINTFPVYKVSIPVDVNLVKQNGTVNPKDSVVSEVRFDIPKDILMKNDLAVLNVIAANKWKRPIYFTSQYDELGFGRYLRKDGLAYRFVPVEGDNINTDWMADKLMNKFTAGNANIRGVYFDEPNRRQLIGIRSAYAELAFDLAAKGRKEEARKFLLKADKMMPEYNFPYGHISAGNMHNRSAMAFLEACYRADAKNLVKKVENSVKNDLTQQVHFYNSLDGSKAEAMAMEKNMAENLLNTMENMKEMYAPGLKKENGLQQMNTR